MNVFSDCLVRRGARKVWAVVSLLILMNLSSHPALAQEDNGLLGAVNNSSINGLDSLPGIDPSPAYRAGAFDKVSTPADENKVLCFYNVGTKKFLSIGGLWGTHASISPTPYALWLESDDENATAWYVHDKVEGSETGHHIGIQNGDLWMDQSLSTSLRSVSFEKAAGYTDQNKLYTIKIGNDGYLTTYPDNENKYCNYQKSLYATTDSRYANQVWKVITRVQYYTLSLANPANMEAVVDFSFLMQAPDFRVNDLNIAKWQITGDKADDAKKKILFGDNTMYCTYANSNQTGKSHFTNYSGGHQQAYGKYFYAYTKGAHGYTLYQDVEIHKSGWYLLRCNGFTTQTALDQSGMDRPAAYIFIARVKSDKSQPEYASSATLNLMDKAEANALVASDNGSGAGKAFFEGAYENQVQLCFDEAADGKEITADNPLKVRIGIYVETLSDEPADDDLTCVDNFKLLYAGPRRNPELILDEDNDHLLYLSRAKDSYKNSVLHLHRTLNPHKWNSLVLPVNLTWGQMKRTFGNDVKVAKLAALSNTTVQFVTVECKQDSDLMVKAFEPYIVYPPVVDTHSPAYTASHFYTREGDDNSHWLKADCSGETNVESDRFTLTIPANHYDITMVSFDRDAFIKHLEQEDGTGNSNWISTTRFSADGQVGHMECLGTMAKTFNDDGIIPGRDKLSGDYFFYKGDLIQVPHDKEYGLKAFRCWFELNGTHDIEQGKKMSFYLDGVSQGDATGIETPQGDQVFSARRHRLSSVYNLQGQRVSATASLQGLPGGIYIVNGKKIVIR